MSSIPIWSSGGERDILLRQHLRLPEPCRNGEVCCFASGPYHLYVDGVRLASGTGGLLLDLPKPERHQLEGAWDSGEIEILVVARAGVVAAGWFSCEGRLHHARIDGDAADHGIDLVSGIDWQARGRRQDNTSPDEVCFERLMAADASVAGDAWQGVRTAVVSEPLDDEEMTGAQETSVAPKQLLAVGSVPSSAAIDAAALESVGNSKCVHHDALLAGAHGTTQIRTAPGRSVQLQYDLGRQVWGWPALRLRGGRDGVVDMVLSSRRETSEYHLRYHCGEARQEVTGLNLVRARYMTVRLTGFDEEDLALEDVAIIERSCESTVRSQVQIDASLDAAWDVGAASLRGVRQEAYGPQSRPQRYDWLAGWILQSNDLAQTGIGRVARQTLLGCLPAAPFEASDLAYLLALRDYVHHTGDRAVADLSLDRVRQLLTEVPPLIDRGSTSSSVAATSALALAGLDALTELVEALELPVEVAPVREQAHHRLDACWNGSTGLYAESPDGDRFHQYTNGLALLSLSDPERGATIEQALRGQGVEPVSDLTQVWLLAAGLGHAGRRQRLLDVIGNHWLRRLNRPGTTWRDKRASDATGPAPGPEALWLRYLFGVRPLAPGWSVREIVPPFDLLTRGQITVPMGATKTLDMAWAPDRDDEDTGETQDLSSASRRLDLQIGAEGETHLRLDRCGQVRPTISVNGEVVWRNEKIFPNPNVHMIAAEENHVLLILERSGRFRIRIE